MTGQKEKKQQIFCPYCDSTIIKADFPYCQSCHITIFYCPECKKPLPRDNNICPHCGAEIRD